MQRKDPEFATRLKEALKRVGITQKEAAARIGISEHGMSNYARGRIPEARILYRIAHLCNCSMEWLLAGKGPGPAQRPISPARRPAEAGWARAGPPEAADLQSIIDQARRVMKEEAKAVDLIRLIARVARLDRATLDRLADRPGDGPSDLVSKKDDPSYSLHTPLEILTAALGWLTDDDLRTLHAEISRRLK